MPEVELPNPKELEAIKEKRFERRVALTTAVFAVVLAIAALGANKTMKEMLLAQQQASDQWAFYQARSIREHQYRIQKLRLEADLAERGPAMKPDARQRYEALLAKLAEEEKRYNAEKQEVEREARALERERDVSRARDPYFEFAEVLLQIAIVMSSISILSGSRPVFLISLAVASVGAWLTLNGYTLLVNVPFLHGGH
jgi:uncharacterized protein DUF4337